MTPSMHFGKTSNHRVLNYVRFNNGHNQFKKLKHSFRPYNNTIGSCWQYNKSIYPWLFIFRIIQKVRCDNDDKMFWFDSLLTLAIFTIATAIEAHGHCSIRLVRIDTVRTFYF